MTSGPLSNALFDPQLCSSAEKGTDLHRMTIKTSVFPKRCQQAEKTVYEYVEKAVKAAGLLNYCYA